MSEKSLGELWAEEMRGEGSWVEKVPAILTGFPDWLMVRRPEGICMIEAKLLQEGGSAFMPSQCSRAQRFWLGVVARHGGAAFVLVLGPDAWYMERVKNKVKRISRRVFERLKCPYKVNGSR